MNQILFFLLFSIYLFGQNTTNDSIIYFNKKKLFSESFQKSFANEIATVEKNYTGKLKKDLVNAYKKFSVHLGLEIAEDNFSFDDSFDSVLKLTLQKFNLSALGKIDEHNFAIKKEVDSNAFCLPNGTIIVNLGMFDLVDNEHQLAAVLAHEIGHKSLNHNLISIQKYYQTTPIDLEKIKEIKKSKYNRADLALEFAKETFYKNAKENRKMELQADSIGYVLFKQSGFEKTQFIEAMKKIENDKSFQKQIVIDSLVYTQIFNLPKQIYKPSWTKNEDFSDYNYNLYKEKIDKDSVSTHPEWKIRIERIETLFPELKINPKNKPENPKTSPKFSEAKKLANLKRIETLDFQKEYGLALYLCLFELGKEPKNEFYRQWLGKLFHKLAESLDKYELNKHLEHKNPKDQTDSYMFFLNFIWNLNYDEMQTIANHYTKK